MNAKQTAFEIIWIASVISLIAEAAHITKRMLDKKNSK